tara:strand:- start:252 stop:416 length:165 start_codon:yes stop_codon:yes gene_type:complete
MSKRKESKDMTLDEQIQDISLQLKDIEITGFKLQGALEVLMQLKKDQETKSKEK